MYSIPTNNRDFERVVKDINNAVLSVIRFRKRENEDKIDWRTLGTGFFISSQGHFLTCYHVINPLKNPHKDGDGYRLISRLSGSGSRQFAWYDIPNVRIGTNLFLNSEKDAALLSIPDIDRIEKEKGISQPYFVLNGSSISDGKEIGVIGYPLARLSFKDNDINKPVLGSFIPRVSKNVISSKQLVNTLRTENEAMKNVSIVEVNFLFVPGNSGGPVFDASTGEALAYVHGFRSILLKTRIIEAKLSKSLIGKIKNFLKGIPNKFIDTEKAIYSSGVTVDNIKEFLGQHKIQVK
ncbi:serine protease [Patescibacteria group bacterium]